MIDLSIRSRFSCNYQASRHNQFNPSAVVHLDGQSTADIQAGLMAERGPEPARLPPESAYMLYGRFHVGKRRRP
jgi:hypothetical protein